MQDLWSAYQMAGFSSGGCSTLVNNSFEIGPLYQHTIATVPLRRAHKGALETWTYGARSVHALQSNVCQVSKHFQPSANPLRLCRAPLHNYNSCIQAFFLNL